MSGPLPEPDIHRDYEALDDAIRDILDITEGFCRHMEDEEKLRAIRAIGLRAIEAAGAQRHL